MKTIKYFAAIAAITLSSSVFASTTLSDQPTEKMNQVGVVTASGATSLSELQADLAAKAQAVGAQAYAITSVSGNNRLHGSAAIYR